MIEWVDEFAEAMSILRKYRSACRLAGLEYEFLFASVAAGALHHKGIAYIQSGSEERRSAATQIRKAHAIFLRAMSKLSDEAAKCGVTLPEMSAVLQKSNGALLLAAGGKRSAA